MKNKQNKNLVVAALDSELKRIYHNATLKGKLVTESDFEQDLYNDAFNFECDVALMDLNNGITFGLEKFVEKYGEVFTLGRGGRTCSPEFFINFQGGSRFKIKTISDLDTSYSRLVEVYQDLKTFNDYVIEFCRTMPDQVFIQLRQDFKTEIELNKNKRRKTRQVVSYE